MELHHVIVEKLCSCAKKEGMERIVSFESKEEAQSAAEAKLAHMQNDFCSKHEFDVTEVNDHFVIGMLGGCDCGSHEKH
jgi:redox-regulated HSP33 family molecular chaperone